MASSETSDGPGRSTVRYGTDGFDRQVRERLEEDAPGGMRFLFYGGTDDQHQRALSDLTSHTAGPLHQVEAHSLLEDRRHQTQNNLRKVFDHATEEGALLHFEGADAFFIHEHTASSESQEDVVPTLSEYVIDRFDAYDGAVVLALDRPDHLEQAQAGTDLVVRFDG